MMDTAPAPLAVEGISKGFPGVQALQGISFDCRAGEIHALVGENGAGKSTLMRILSGVHQPDAGTIKVDGRVVTVGLPAEAARLGIAMVYQDTRLVPDLDVAQNVFLGHEPGGALIDYPEMRLQSARLLAMLGESLDLRRPVRELAVAERQVVEIARALSIEARVLILDEPTSALTPAEVERLFAILRELRRSGASIIFISHRLPEIFAIADRITVMKDGEIVRTVATAETSQDAVVSMMVGRSLALAFPPRGDALGTVVLAARGLAVPEKLAPATFETRAGEVLGLGGIAGGGQTALVRALFGMEPASGTLALDGKPLVVRTPAEAIAAGIVYLPADRRGEGMFLPHSVRENIALPHVAEWSRLGIVDTGREAKSVAQQVEALAIKTPSAEQPVGLLSGGNQQKVAFARWLLSNPRLCIFDEPTQGVDVGTKLEIYRIIRAIAARGVAVLVVSSDVLELIGLSDRILVAAKGRIVDEVKGADATEERIVGSAVGVGETGGSVAASGPTRAAAARSEAGSVALRRYWPAVLLTILIVAFTAYTASQSPYFLTTRNMANLAVQVSPLLIVALGQLTVVLIGGIDLSVGPTISLTTAIASFLLVPDPPFGFAAGVAICLAAGLAIGLANGILIRLLKLPDLIATLATFSAVAGLALIVRPAPGGLLSSDFADWVLMRTGNVPILFVLALLGVLLYEAVLLRSRIGLRLYAVGSSEDAAYVAGVAVGRVRLLAYLFCGFLAAVAGLVVAARIGSGDPQAGTNFTLLSVTAVVLGGTSIFGGRGTAIGVLAASVLIMLIQSAMNQLQVSAYWQYVLTGALTLIAVALYAQRGDGRSGPAFSRLLRRRRTPMLNTEGEAR
jgi:ribose transport system ATP-binding protein